ncbi:hypothetical protein T4E_4085, partial [Trichinella pseudospiralis]
LFMVALGARKFNANFYTNFLTAFFFTSFYVKYLCLVFWNLQQAAVVLLMSMTMYGKVGLLCRHLPYQASMKLFLYGFRVSTCFLSPYA